MWCSKRAGSLTEAEAEAEGEPLICKMAHPSHREHQGTVCAKTHTHSSPGMHLTPVDDWYARGYFCPTAGKRGQGEGGKKKKRKGGPKIKRRRGDGTTGGRRGREHGERAGR